MEGEILRRRFGITRTEGKWALPFPCKLSFPAHTAIGRDGILKLEEALGLSSDAAILSAMQSLRTTVDAMEKKVSDSRWPLPKYRDMLFLY